MFLDNLLLSLTIVLMVLFCWFISFWVFALLKVIFVRFYYKKTIFFNSSNIEERLKSLSLKNGDVLVYGVKGMSKKDYLAHKDLILKHMPSGCMLFIVFNHVGFVRVDRGAWSHADSFT